MNADPNFEEQVLDRLAARLDAVSASTDLTAPAIARAGAIRRRRRAVAAASAALATIAVAAPFIWWNVHGPDAPPVPAVSSTRPTTITSAPSTTSAPGPSSSSSGAQSTSPATPRAIPTGDADTPAVTVSVDPGAPLVARPDVPYILDTTLHRGGASLTFHVRPEFSYQPLARGRSLLIERGPGGRGYDLAKIVDASGTLVAEIPATRGQYLVGSVNDAGTLVALMDSSMQGSEPTATLSVFDDAGAPLYQKRKVLSDVTIAGFVGKRVFLGNSRVNRSYVWDLERGVIDRYTDSGVVKAVSERTGRAAFFELDENDVKKNCTTVSTVTGSRPVPVSVTCGAFQPRELSRDGRYLLGIEPGDGMLQGPSTVIDVATGKALVLFDEDRPLDIDSGFLADGSVVLNLVPGSGTGPTQNTLLRCTLDGGCTRLVETVSIPDFGTTMAPRYGIVRE